VFVFSEPKVTSEIYKLEMAIKINLSTTMLQYSNFKQETLIEKILSEG
jgi:hypothetical protein